MKRPTSLTLAAVMLATLAPAQPLQANDSMAGMALGGLQFIRSDDVALREQFLHITHERIRVRYVFRNESAEPVDALIAFPLPALSGHEYDYVPIPYPDRANYVGFRTWIDGEEIEPNVESRALLLGIDVTERLRALDVPLVAFDYNSVEAIRALPAETFAALQEDLLIDRNGFPQWQLATSLWRRQGFAPGVDVVVEHAYTPVRGGSVASPIGNVPPSQSGEWIDQARARYCIEPEMEAAMYLRQNVGDEYHYLTFAASEVEYLLTPGGNWRGPIGHFRLIVEAPHPEDYVFMCEDRARRVAPNRIEIDEVDFYPWRDLDILIPHLVGEGIERDGW